MQQQNFDIGLFQGCCYLMLNFHAIDNPLFPVGTKEAVAFGGQDNKLDKDIDMAAYFSSCIGDLWHYQLVDKTIIKIIDCYRRRMEHEQQRSTMPPIIKDDFYFIEGPISLCTQQPSCHKIQKSRKLTNIIISWHMWSIFICILFCSKNLLTEQQSIGKKEKVNHYECYIC